MDGEGDTPQNTRERDRWRERERERERERLKWKWKWCVAEEEWGHPAVCSVYKARGVTTSCSVWGHTRSRSRCPPAVGGSWGEHLILQIPFPATGVNLCTIKGYLGHFWLTHESNPNPANTQLHPLISATVVCLQTTVCVCVCVCVSGTAPLLMSPRLLKLLLSSIKAFHGYSCRHTELAHCVNMVNMIAGGPEPQYRCVLSHWAACRLLWLQLRSGSKR